MSGIDPLQPFQTPPKPPQEEFDWVDVAIGAMVVLPSLAASLASPWLARVFSSPTWLMIVLALIQGFALLLLVGRREQAQWQVAIFVLGCVVVALSIFGYLMALVYFAPPSRG